MELDDENAKLRKLLAEAMLDNAMPKDLSTGRPAVAQLCRTHQMSQRRRAKLSARTAARCDIATCARTMRTCTSGGGSRPASAADSAIGIS
jgi:hypothetical protein